MHEDSLSYVIQQEMKKLITDFQSSFLSIFIFFLITKSSL